MVEYLVLAALSLVVSERFCKVIFVKNRHSAGPGSIETVDGRDPAPPGIYKSPQEIMVYCMYVYLYASWWFQRM